MPPSFHPRLINGPFDDPGLFLPFSFEKRAFVFDLGDVHSLSNRDILKITHGFVSHTHMDHFVGFDRLLRLFLGRGQPLHLFGPTGFLGHVEGKLAAYNWNLVENYAEGFVLKVTEVDGERMLTNQYPCRKRFVAESRAEETPFAGLLLDEPTVAVAAVILEHQIPCLAFSLKERFHVNIKKTAVEALGVLVGPWLAEFKAALYAGEKGDTSIDIHSPDGRGKKSFRVQELADKIALITPGRKIVYVTDTVGSPENMAKIIHFANEADHLYIEAAFLHRDRDTALEKYHLTARQSGEIAAKAGVKNFSLFHFSPRYTDQAGDLESEAREAFAEFSQGTGRTGASG